MQQKGAMATAEVCRVCERNCERNYMGRGFGTSGVVPVAGHAAWRLAVPPVVPKAEAPGPVCGCRQQKTVARRYEVEAMDPLLRVSLKQQYAHRTTPPQLEAIAQHKRCNHLAAVTKPGATS
jgi:hypothetical protein